MGRVERAERRLEQLGLVRRQAYSNDRRVRRMRAFERSLLAGLSELQLAELRKTLFRIGDNLESHTQSD